MAARLGRRRRPRGAVRGRRGRRAAIRRSTATGRSPGISSASGPARSRCCPPICRRHTRSVAAGRLDAYLDAQGVRGLAPGRERAEAALHCFLARVFEDSTDFVFHELRFDSAFRELEGVVGDGRSESLCVAVLLGIELQSDEVGLGDGLSIVRGDAFAEAPDEARWDGDRWHAQHARRTALGAARRRPGAAGRGPLTARPDADRAAALRRRGGRVRAAGLDAHCRRAVAAAGARPVPGPRDARRDQRRAGGRAARVRQPRGAADAEVGGEIPWALRRFDASFECADPAGALTEVLLALRALLEPEGPRSGRLPGRVAALCAVPTTARVWPSASPTPPRWSGRSSPGSPSTARARAASPTSSRATCARCCATCSAAIWTPTCARSPTRSSQDVAAAERQTVA